MSNAVRRAALLSPTINVRPSGVMTGPFGKLISSAATHALPSGSTAMMLVLRHGSPAYMSKPKLPTYARPRASTTMSLQFAGARSARSAWTASVPP